MTKKYMNRISCMSAKAYYVPVANGYPHYNYGYDESLIEGNGAY